jgi:hypothetical protein
MSETEFELRNLIQTRFAGLDTLVDALNASLLEGAITRTTLSSVLATSAGLRPSRFRSNRDG